LEEVAEEARAGGAALLGMELDADERAVLDDRGEPFACCRDC
jgi:hypothetical protein